MLVHLNLLILASRINIGHLVINVVVELKGQVPCTFDNLFLLLVKYFQKTHKPLSRRKEQVAFCVIDV